MIKTYKTRKNSVDFDLKFNSKLTLIDGDSGVGKTMLFQALERDALLENKKFICLNYRDKVNKSLDNIIGKVHDETIVIDNADVILTLEHKSIIAMDDSNQYIIFARDIQGYHPTEKSLATLKIENNKGYLHYEFM